MLLSLWLLKLHSLRLKFLLPLPLLLIAFALSGELLTNQLLSRSYDTSDKLLADTQTVKAQLALNVQVQEAEIETERDFTTVEVKTANSVLKKLEFEFPTTELSMEEAKIAQALGVSSQVKNLPAGTQLKIEFPVNVLGILAEIRKEEGFTKVEVKTANSVLQQLEYEFPVTELSTVKTMIGQEVGLSSENATTLVSYRVKN